MATRRQMPTRTTRTGSSSMAPPSRRPPSALSRSNGSARSGLATPVEDSERSTPGPPSTSSTATTAPSPAKRRPVQAGRQPVPVPIPTGSSPGPGDDPGSNIQVVIRCRRRSEKEMAEGSPSIVTTEGPKSKEVTIETAAPVSSLGIVTLAPTRTYPFDLVFGPEADQALIYQDVVSPMLDEVVRGYNCTLFAYGQTGTGKTYTMQGDIKPTPMGNPSAHAGMIPRVLFRLFHELESSSSDYSVKISFIELYNEELRDLLAPELSAPIGTVQPMGLGSSKDSNKNELKIFEDSNKRGVTIHGLEEANVANAVDALALLNKGSERRQVAATKFNDHSSRSHSVFSITVHVKESGAGDDMLRVGKLNLVDLAGSENIGRSGAENKRAREAGMINQSLLTLGRVINALVEKSSHVPYRESKLTRLLQDSLGGRTKTCIVATISPARSNMEETLSTLDYAIRAKSIRNRPELNQRMNRNSLLKEYITEIERLKADVLAAREKNGTWFSDERVNAMNAEAELRRSELEEAKREVAIVEMQMKRVREEFEQGMALLMKREGELKDTKEKLHEREGELVVKDGQLRVVKTALEEEVVVRRAFQDNEPTLDEVANGLKAVAAESLSDLERLFDSFERNSAVMSSNSEAVKTHGKGLTDEFQNMAAKLDDFVKASDQRTSQLKVEAELYKSQELEALGAHSQQIDEQLQSLQEAMEVISAEEEGSSEAVGALQVVIKQVYDNIRTGFKAWSEGLRRTCDALCQELEAANDASKTSVEEAVTSIASVIETLVIEAHAYLESERNSLLEAKAIAEEASNAEIQRLREQNAHLTQLLEAERAKAQHAKDELIERISGLLGTFTEERDRSLREAVSHVQAGNNTAEEHMADFSGRHGEKIEEALTRGNEWKVTVERRGSEGKRTRDGAFKMIGDASSTFKDGMSRLQGTVDTSLTAQSTDLKREMQTLASGCNEGFEKLDRAKRARIEATHTMAGGVQSGYRSLQHGLESTSRNVERVSDTVTSEAAGLSNTVGEYHTDAAEHLSTVRETTETLVGQGTRDDGTSGSTPKKREWRYVDNWELTKSREQLLREWRSLGESDIGSDTFIAEHLPLPDGKGEDEDIDMAELLEDPQLAILNGHAEDDGAVSSEEVPPSTASMSSTGSATSSSASMKRLKMGLPTAGKLTEQPANGLANGRRYR